MSEPVQDSEPIPEEVPVSNIDNFLDRTANRFAEKVDPEFELLPQTAEAVTALHEYGIEDRGELRFYVRMWNRAFESYGDETQLLFYPMPEEGTPGDTVEVGNGLSVLIPAGWRGMDRGDKKRAFAQHAHTPRAEGATLKKIMEYGREEVYTNMDDLIEQAAEFHVKHDTRALREKGSILLATTHGSLHAPIHGEAINLAGYELAFGEDLGDQSTALVGTRIVTSYKNGTIPPYIIVPQVAGYTVISPPTKGGEVPGARMFVKMIASQGMKDWTDKLSTPGHMGTIAPTGTTDDINGQPRQTPKTAVYVGLTPRPNMRVVTMGIAEAADEKIAGISMTMHEPVERKSRLGENGRIVFETLYGTDLGSAVENLVNTQQSDSTSGPFETLYGTDLGSAVENLVNTQQSDSTSGPEVEPTALQDSPRLRTE